MNQEVKFCKDCKHRGYSGIYCRSPNNGIRLIDGTAKVRFSEVNRSESYFGLDTCGKEGKWWEAINYYKEAETKQTSYWQKLKTYFN